MYRSFTQFPFSFSFARFIYKIWHLLATFTFFVNISIYGVYNLMPTKKYNAITFSVQIAVLISLLIDLINCFYWTRFGLAVSMCK